MVGLNTVIPDSQGTDMLKTWWRYADHVMMVKLSKCTILVSHRGFGLRMARVLHNHDAVRKLANSKLQFNDKYMLCYDDGDIKTVCF